MNTPIILWTLITIIAIGHSDVVARTPYLNYWLCLDPFIFAVTMLPYPIVCWVSILNRKAEVKSTKFSTHTTWPGSLSDSESKSPGIKNNMKRTFICFHNHHTMNQSNQIPDYSKEKPGNKVGTKEVKESPRPRKVDGWDKKVFHYPELI